MDIDQIAMQLAAALQTEEGRQWMQKAQERTRKQAEERRLAASRPIDLFKAVTPLW